MSKCGIFSLLKGHFFLIKGRNGSFTLWSEFIDFKQAFAGSVALYCARYAVNAYAVGVGTLYK